MVVDMVIKEISKRDFIIRSKTKCEKRKKKGESNGKMKI